MNNKILFGIAMTGMLMATGCKSTEQNGKEQEIVPAIDLADLDQDTKPQDDFYQFANGGWMAANPLKPEYSRFGTFDVLRDRSQERINEIIKTLKSQENEKGTNEYRIATLYNQAMDMETRNTQGAEPIQGELRAIEAIQDKDQLIELMAKNDNKGESTLFTLYVMADAKNSDMNILNLFQTSLALGNRDYYVKDDADSKKNIEAYNQYINKIAQLAGYSAEDAQRIMDNNIAISRQLAEISYSQEELRDTERNYNMVTITDFAQEQTAFNWNKYLELRNLSNIESWNVAQKDFFTKFNTWFKTVDINAVKDYLIASTIDGGCSALSDDFVAASFEFYGKTLQGKQEQQPLWKRATNTVNSSLGEALGRIYVDQYFPAESKDRMIELVSNLQSALNERITNLAWMSDETKAKAIEKLSNFTVKIGYPDQWKDYSSMNIDAEKSFYENLMAVGQFYQDDNMNDLGKPVDKAKWLMNPQDVNAYYMPNTNEICFPAGILEPPFFNKDADDAVNYGAIGVVIGHEMTHGFDDQGSNFDVNGNMINWWTSEDKEKFNNSTKVLVDQFNALDVTSELKANGAMTLGENIADQGGLLISYLALQKAIGDKEVAAIDGFTPWQRFFIGYARVWGQNITEEGKIHLTKMDVHSLGMYRVNQSLKNIGAFYEAFDIKEGDKMYIAPEERVMVW